MNQLQKSKENDEKKQEIDSGILKENVNNQSISSYIKGDNSVLEPLCKSMSIEGCNEDPGGYDGYYASNDDDDQANGKYYAAKEDKDDDDDDSDGYAGHWSYFINNDDTNEGEENKIFIPETEGKGELPFQFDFDIHNVSPLSSTASDFVFDPDQLLQASQFIPPPPPIIFNSRPLAKDQDDVKLVSDHTKENHAFKPSNFRYFIPPPPPISNSRPLAKGQNDVKLVFSDQTTENHVFKPSNFTDIVGLRMYQDEHVEHVVTEDEDDNNEKLKDDELNKFKTDVVENVADDDN